MKFHEHLKRIQKLKSEYIERKGFVPNIIYLGENELNAIEDAYTKCVSINTFSKHRVICVLGSYLLQMKVKLSPYNDIRFGAEIKL